MTSTRRSANRPNKLLCNSWLTGCPFSIPSQDSAASSSLQGTFYMDGSPAPMNDEQDRLLEQLRSEDIQVIAPVNPGMAAGAFFIHDVEAVLLEHLNSRSSCFNQEVILACAEPEELQTFLESSVVERREISILPAVGVWSRR